MNDPEKVINDLNVAKLILCNPQTLTFEMKIKIGQAITNGITMLKKEQEAVPVIQREIMHMLFWCCGSCGVAITEGDKFCRNCGKKVKWNG